MTLRLLMAPEGPRQRTQKLEAEARSTSARGRLGGVAADLIQTKLARYIEQVAADTADGKVPPKWGGHQLAALIRHWGYRGHDWPTPEEFDQFDLVLMDLECYPDGSRTSDADIVEAAQAVKRVARTL